MPPLTIYSIRDRIGSRLLRDFDDVVDLAGHSVAEVGPSAFPEFDAKLYVARTAPHEPPWQGFLQEGFPNLTLPRTSAVGALLVIRLRGGQPRMFACSFGVSGRFLLRDGAYDRAYGLRTALNLMYPSGTPPDADLARIRAIDAKRRGLNTVRSRQQASQASTLEAFDLDRLRDVVGGATGRPATPDVWGNRIGGGDPLHLSLSASFDDLGTLCRQITEAHDRTDYRERFAWLDHVQPVTDPDVIGRLEEAVVLSLRQNRIDELELAPPEILDWSRVASFRFHFDRRQRPPLNRPDLRLTDFLTGVRAKGDLADVDAGWLRRRHVNAVDTDGSRVHQWTVWRSLVGEMELDDVTYVLDEGEFFAVDRDYVRQLDNYIADVPASTVVLPPSPGHLREPDYNRRTAQGSGYLLLDRELIRTSSATTPIEVCDLLTPQRQLIHVKRHLGSRDLSHLFSQGVVSAELLQVDQEFRQAVKDRVANLTGDGSYAFFDPTGIRTGEFEVVYAVIADWAGRTLAQALPFFSKINLRRSAENLAVRGYGVSWAQVAVDRG